MKIRVRARDIASTQDLIPDTDRQLRRAMGRFARRISAIGVRLFDINGDRGGVDKACEVTVSLGRAGTVRYRAVASTAAAAMALAVSGIRGGVGRHLAVHRGSRRRLARRRRDLAGGPRY